MRCAWNELLRILPSWMRPEVDWLGRSSLQELRLRIGAKPELVCTSQTHWMERAVSADDLAFVCNTASRYSPWNASSMEQGYLTAPGGHRIGICGEAVMRGGGMSGIRNVTSLCIRIARDFEFISPDPESLSGSCLILGPPGWGKTTLLRDFIRRISDSGQHVAVVDERGELFPPGADFSKGRLTDVLTGCKKAEGVLMVLRTMGPAVIAVDEITDPRDAEALRQAVCCGVRLLATAHGTSLNDLKYRDEYTRLLNSGALTNLIIMNRDKTWRLERMKL